MRKGKQTSLSNELAALSKKMDRKSDGLLQIKVKQAWSEIAGSTVLSHTTGAHLRGTELVVFVDSGLWATELSAMSSQYEEALSAQLGPRVVKSVRFTVSRKVAEQFRLEEQEIKNREDRTSDAVGSSPLSETEKMQVEASVEGIPNERLRAAVLRATIKDLEWKKGIAAAKESQATPDGL